MNFKLVNWDGYYFTFESDHDEFLQIKIFTTKDLSGAIEKLQTMLAKVHVRYDEIVIDVSGWE